MFLHLPCPTQEILFLKQQLRHERLWKDKYSTLASTLRTELDTANNVKLFHGSGLAKRTLGTPLGDVIQENIPPTNHLCTLVPNDNSSSKNLSQAAGQTFTLKFCPRFFLLCIVLILGIFIVSNSKPDLCNIFTILRQTYTSLISQPIAYYFLYTYLEYFLLFYLHKYFILCLSLVLLTTVFIQSIFLLFPQYFRFFGLLSKFLVLFPKKCPLAFSILDMLTSSLL